MKEKNRLSTAVFPALLTACAYFPADTVDAVTGRGLGAAPQAAASPYRDRAALR